MIVRFTKEEFENVLYKIFPVIIPCGLRQKEEQYIISINNNAQIIIRSSIDKSGIASDTGQNSIRLWLEIWQPDSEGQYHWQPQKKLDAYTTRVNGWEGRLKDKISILWEKGIGKTKIQQPQKGSKVELIPLDAIPIDELPTQEQENDAIDLIDFLTKEEIKPQPISKKPNEQQQKAITANIDANMRVLAPPGSGKSFTNENRYKHLVDNGVNPSNILAVTFGKKMAKEMGCRIAAICPEAKLDQISTIHAFCFRVLCRWYRHSPYFGWTGLEKKKTVRKLTEWEYKNLVDDTIARVWNKDEKPGRKEVLHWIAAAKYNNNFLQEFFTNQLGYRYGLWVYRIASILQSTVEKHNQLTFSDMLWFMEKELEKPEFLKWCQVNFPYVMIDESQDTNSQAMKILFKIVSHSFIVGDVDQMLFRFQGAKPEIITSDYTSNIQTVLLDKNYRSTTEIIRASQLLISHNYSNANGPYDQKFMKDVSGAKDEGSPIIFQMYDNIEDEGQGISETILEQCQNGYEFGSFFVGARTRAQLGYLEGSLFRAKIKFINISCGGSFWQSRHASDVVGYLRLAYDTTDKEALKRVYNIASNDHKYFWNDRGGKFNKGDYCPTRYLGNAFLDKINSDFNSIKKFLDIAKDGWLFGAKGDKAQDLLNFIYDLQLAIDQAENVGQIIQVILDDCYIKWLKTTEGIVANDESEDGKLEDLATIVDIASSFENIDKFLEYVDKMIQEAEDAKQGNWDDYVILSTYHGLKGLERPIVIGTGWCEGYQADTREPRGLLPHTFSLIPPPQFGVLPSGSQSPIEDERCIGFVCISRAQEKVFLTGCQSYRDWILEPSRFIKELELLEEENNGDKKQQESI